MVLSYRPDCKMRCKYMPYAMDLLKPAPDHTHCLPIVSLLLYALYWNNWIPPFLFQMVSLHETQSQIMFFPFLPYLFSMLLSQNKCYPNKSMHFPRPQACMYEVW